MPLNVQIFFSFGLVIWWYVTMLPFVLLVTPLLIRAVVSAFPSIVSKEIKENSFKQEIPHKSFSIAMLVPGLIMLIFGFATSYTSFGFMIYNFFGELTSNLIQLMFFLSGGFLTVLGILFYDVFKFK